MLDTFVQVQQAVVARLHDDTGTLPLIKQWINEAYFDIHNRLNFYWTVTEDNFNTVAGTIEYDLDPNFDVLISTRILINGLTTKLEPIDSERIFDRAISDQNQQGQPTSYRMFGENKMQLWPVPDNTYTVYYKFHRNPAELTGDGDPIAMPQKYRMALVYGALVQAYKYHDDLAGVQQQQAEYEQMIARMKFDNEQNYDSTPQFQNVKFAGVRSIQVGEINPF